MTFYEQMVPLNSIRQAKVHKSLISLLYTVRLYLVDGTMIKFRISKKVYGFATQEENLDNFLTKIKTYT